MSAKKIFYGLAAVCSPFFSVEASTIHTVEDVSDVFRRPTTTVEATMSEYVPNGLSLIKIKGTDPETSEMEARRLRFAPSSVVWQHNDQAVPPYSQKTVVFNIQCGSHVLKVTHDESEKVLHVSELSKSIIVNSSGQLVNPYNLAPCAEGFFSWAQRVWTRPDATQWSQDSKLPVKIEPVVNGHSVPREALFSTLEIQLGVPVPVMKKLTLPTGNHETVLYRIVKKEVPNGQPSNLEYCYHHAKEVQLSLRKMGKEEFRHAYKTYHVQPVIEVFDKINNNGVESRLVLNGGKSFMNVTKLLSQEYIGTGQKNHPKCTAPYNFTTGFPANYRVPPHLL